MTHITNLERISRLRLFRTKGIGCITFNKLLSRFGNAVTAIEQLSEITRRFGKQKTSISEADIMKEIDIADKFGAEILVVGDPDFPNNLACTNGLPQVIFVKGHKHLLNKDSISIVGARNSSPIAMRYAYRLAEDLGKSGIVIVSGLARGIDTQAHIGSLETGTVGILAGGLDIPYPKENTDLYNKMCEQGCVISEMPFGIKPSANLFPVRNRIVAGLSLGTLVVEAEIKSGSLITARLAGEMGRDVFAVPGHPSDGRMRGCIKLLKDGAHPVETPDDIISQLSMFNRSTLNEEIFNPEDFIPVINDKDANSIGNDIIGILTSYPTDIDSLIRNIDKPIGLIKSILLELELSEIIYYTQSGLVSLYARQQ